MASFLRPCTNGCGKQVRFMSKWDIPTEVICDNCVAAIAANEASAKKRRPAKKRRRKA
ncbi:hypothetical protein LCGC14_1502940 [marine sediment metagenome]|uniref:Uncharacterized protein n=1 Tax=marine sediment metagenome TaxID=412755 RepID=A0A0F9J3M9_9ZZZZ